MAILEKGCFCCELVTCVKVQGFVFTAMFLLIAVLNLVFVVVWIVPRERDPGPNADEYDRMSISYAKVICTVSFVSLLIWALLVSLMLYGIYKKRRMLFWPYMVSAALSLLVTMGLLAFYASSVHVQIPRMLMLLVLLGLQSYLLLHVVSLFQKMGEEELAQSVPERAQ